MNACEKQCASESAPLMGWARPDDPDLTDGVCAAAIGHLGEFTAAKRYKRSGGIDRDQVQIGFVGGGLVVVEPHADAVEYGLVELLVRLQLLPPAPTKHHTARWQLRRR